jgi:hypothetical protein
MTSGSQSARRALRALCAAAVLPLLGAGPQSNLGTFGKWSAWAEEDQKGKYCFVHGLPTEQRGDYKTRGQPEVMILHRPASKVRNEISFRAGYDLKEGSALQVVIDGRKTFTLDNVKDDTAWTSDAKTDQELRTAIASGKRMVVTATSRRGTRTTDTYTLSGTTAALDLIDRKCKP